MSYYRKNNFIKNSILNVCKGIVLSGLAVCICGYLNKQVKPATVEAAIYPIPDEAVFCSEEPIVISYNEYSLFDMPAKGVLTSEFGDRWEKKHNGIDIGAAEGDEILAAGDGVVTFSGWVEGYGNYIVLDHENGFETCYAHCSALVSTVGERVSKGQKIALVGSTGNSTGPHLHFEIKLNGVFQNPSDYIIY